MGSVLPVYQKCTDLQALIMYSEPPFISKMSDWRSRLLIWVDILFLVEENS